MATIKAIERSSVHQIQSGQVIVDLCSVVKELVENAVDAGATSLEIRFKNNGIDAVEVVDNGSGVNPDDFDSLALKHYTSKLARYDDLDSLTTFGFRGEALSSLCALSKLSVVTSRKEDAPRGTKLDFDVSGAVKSRTVVAAQKGTTVGVEDIFRNLPVRKRELEKNIKREYGKVLGLLHAYACISTGVRFSVANTPAKGKKAVVFSTNANSSTRDNIANVYGAKTLVALVPLNLVLQVNPMTASTQTARNWATQEDTRKKEIRLKGHISRPVVGEGRQTPDRQMFFVNARPCALPQVSKAINEVYKSYNVTQSPFIFANLELDTNAYDVNVSPDKRTILLHDQTALLEALKESLTQLFEQHDQSVPAAPTPSIKRLPSFKPLAITRPPPVAQEDAEESDASSSSQLDGGAVRPSSILRRTIEGEDAITREHAMKTAMAALAAKKKREAEKANTAGEPAEHSALANLDDDDLYSLTPKETEAAKEQERNGATTVPLVTKATTTASAAPQAQQLPRPVQDFNARMGIQVPARDGNAKQAVESDDSGGEREASTSTSVPADPALTDKATFLGTPEDKIPSVSIASLKATPGAVPSAFDRMRPKRTPPDVATITIGHQTTSMVLGTPEAKRRRIHTPKTSADGKKPHSPTGFISTLRVFSAPGTRDDEDDDEEGDDEPVQATSALRAKSKSSSKAHPVNSSMAATITDLSSEVLDLDNVSAESRLEAALFLASEDGTDDEYMDEDEKKAREEAKIAKMIEATETNAAKPSVDNAKRAVSVMKSRTNRKGATLNLVQTLETNVDRIETGLQRLSRALGDIASIRVSINATEEGGEKSAEERLSLTVSKKDFNIMRIIGQFNLGFILASRTSSTPNTPDELFIIDQHASDEKYNFERLQSQTIVQTQRLVHPKQLDLTAIEEEIISNHGAALEKNGFKIFLDESGKSGVGQRCKLTSLPTSCEVTFSLSDLEELLSLLSEHPPDTSSTHTPRPSKVRKMFAMRACRSSIMVGKTLGIKQMEKVVRHMGELDKPWNCPHGRPTMRHLYSLDGWEGWEENGGEEVDWEGFANEARVSGLLVEDEEQGRNGDECMEGEENPAEWLFTQAIDKGKGDV